jgi:hypothetical protein
MDAEKAAIWNSPQMLRARAWLHDYTSKSAKITPEEGQKYMQELENLTPTQMKLWLLKFEHEEEIKQQQMNMWQQSQQALAAQAQAANRASMQSLAGFDQAQSQAANEEQGQLNEEAEVRQQRSEENQFAPIGPYGPYNWGFNPGYGGVHFHYHLYPHP